MELGTLCFSLGREEALGLGPGLTLNSMPSYPLLQEEFFLKKRNRGLRRVVSRVSVGEP